MRTSEALVLEVVVVHVVLFRAFVSVILCS